MNCAERARRDRSRSPTRTRGRRRETTMPHTSWPRPSNAAPTTRWTRGGCATGRERDGRVAVLLRWATMVPNLTPASCASAAGAGQRPNARAFAFFQYIVISWYVTTGTIIGRRRERSLTVAPAARRTARSTCSRVVPSSGGSARRSRNARRTASATASCNVDAIVLGRPAAADHSGLRRLEPAAEIDVDRDRRRSRRRPSVLRSRSTSSSTPSTVPST